MPAFGETEWVLDGLNEAERKLDKSTGRVCEEDILAVVWLETSQMVHYSKLEIIDCIL